jgi:hypothetical protein
MAGVVRATVGTAAARKQTAMLTGATRTSLSAIIFDNRQKPITIRNEFNRDHANINLYICDN